MISEGLPWVLMIMSLAIGFGIGSFRGKTENIENKRDEN